MDKHLPSLLKSFYIVMAFNCAKGGLAPL